MQLSFDPRDRNAATAALAAILALHPDISTGVLATTTGPTIAEMIDSGILEGPRGEPDIRVTTPAPPAPPAAPNPPAPPSVDDTADPATAFGAAPNAAPAAPAPSGGDGAGVASPNPGGVEIDKNGLPWDGRIHAGTKGKIADGSWRKKVGVTPELTAQVEAELRAALGAPPAPEAASPAPIPPAPVAAPAPPAPVAAVPVPPAAPPAPAPTPPVAPTASGEAAAIPAVSDFAGLMRKITGLQAAGKLSVEDTTANCAALGINLSLIHI